MSSKEIIESEKNNRDCIILYKEGIFWKAYQHSAFALSTQVKPLKAQRRALVCLDGGDIVYVGFPQSSADKFLEGLQKIKEGEKIAIYRAKSPIAEQEFENWKESIAVTEKKSNRERSAGERRDGVVGEIIAQIRNFNVAESTPKDCLLFLAELKKRL